MTEKITPDVEFFQELEKVPNSKEASKGGIQIYKGSKPIVPFKTPKNQE